MAFKRFDQAGILQPEYAYGLISKGRRQIQPLGAERQRTDAGRWA